MTEIKRSSCQASGCATSSSRKRESASGSCSHRSGREELYFPHPDDLDAFKRMLGLSDKDARTLAEMLGGSRVAEELAELQHRIEVSQLTGFHCAMILPMSAGRLEMPYGDIGQPWLG
jgi:K+/H+ antiporter YhaU regulatory subunit KhtT